MPKEHNDTVVSAYIVAGGKSSRFGSDKARAVLDGVPLILRVADSLQAVCEDVIAVADVPGKYADLGLPTIVDRREGQGPLAGLEAALSHRLERLGPGWVIVASCDLVVLRPEWIASLLARAGGGHFAVAYRTAFWEPFPAACHTATLPVVGELLDSGKASFQRLLSDERTGTLALERPADWPDLLQANTPDELEQARRQLR